MESYFLGIDNGGTMSKAALFNEKGMEIAVAGNKVSIIQAQSGWNERDASKMWEDTVSAIQEVIHLSGINANQIKALACTGYGNGLCLVDQEGKPVRNAINSTDSRAQSYIDKWTDRGVGEKVLPLTAQSIWAAQPNALLSWLRDKEPETMEKARWILMAKDFIRLKLTGELCAEITDMSGTSLMNVVSGEYDNEVLRIFGLEEFREMLPPLIASTDLAGRITEEAAGLTGLVAGTPVAGGMFDIDACGLASGIIDDKQMSLVVGTWGNNQYIAKEPLIDRDLFMTSIYSIPGWYLMLEGSPTSASNLDWMIQNLLINEKEQKGDQFFTWMNEQLDTIPPESTDLVFLPFLYGCNEEGSLNAGFFNMRGENTRGHLIRAVYEGIVFAHKTHVERLLNFRDTPEVIRCTGGASQSDTWMQMFADILGIPLEIPAGSQLGALGAAMAATVCSGTYANFHEAIENMTNVQRRFEPEQAKKDIYSDKYHKYKEIIRRLNNTY